MVIEGDTRSLDYSSYNSYINHGNTGWDVVPSFPVVQDIPPPANAGVKKDWSWTSGI